MSNIDQWAAEQCGIEWIAVREGWFWYPINHAITEVNKEAVYRAEQELSE